MSQFYSEHIENLREIVLKGEAPAVIDEIINIAAKERASDIHIEPLGNHVRVRIRVDGILHVLVEYALNLHGAVVSRIKVMSNLKIDEKRKPQDGRISIPLRDSTPIDLRISTYPTINGEKVVMRLADRNTEIPTLDKLGLEGRNLRLVEEYIQKNNGIILTTGPTGSGKSTTLYACLNILNKENVNILTLEDPVEIQVPGLNQSQVHAGIGYSFSQGLRNALRQDPDIMMVGEIRDKETLETATEAALTGHLVFSTLHTNSAVETITRLLNMNVPRYLITSTVQIIIAQRLARKLCPSCSEQQKPSEVVKKQILEEIAHIPTEELQVRIPTFDKNDFTIPIQGEGCEACNGIGYKGRVGIYEIVEFTEDIKEALLKEESILHLTKIAEKEGTVFLRGDGIIRMLQGLTTLEEVLMRT